MLLLLLLLLLIPQIHLWLQISLDVKFVQIQHTIQRYKSICAVNAIDKYSISKGSSYLYH